MPRLSTTSRAPTSHLGKLQKHLLREAIERDDLDAEA